VLGLALPLNHYVYNPFLHMLTPTDCPDMNLDLIFLVDESGSIDDAAFQMIRDFLSDTVSRFSIEPDNTRVGVIGFGTSAFIRFPLNQNTDLPSLLSAISNLPNGGGFTNTAAALDLLVQQGFTIANGARPLSQQVPRIGIVVTDGNSDNSAATATAAANARSAGITLIAIVVGGGVNMAELLSIASNPSLVSTTSAFDEQELDALVDTIISDVCQCE